MASARATWAEGEKQVIATAIAEGSRVWFSLARGRLTEVFYPTPDRACVRSLDAVVAVDGWLSAEDADANATYTQPHHDVPLVRAANEDRAGRYRIDRETVADPHASAVVQRVRWRGPAGARLYWTLVPSIANCLDGQRGRCVDHPSGTMLVAERDGTALALACSRPWRGSVRSDDRGHVALTGILEVGGDETFDLALAFAASAEEAMHVAAGALARGHDAICEHFVAEWRRWMAQAPRRDAVLWTRSIVTLKALEAKSVDGGRVAALSTPWGTSRGPGRTGTYHVVWIRDLVEAMGGMLAAGIHDEALAALTYLRITQEPHGGWPRNMLVDGERVWRGEELDEAGAAVLLVDLLRREQVLSDRDLELAWPMVLRAAQHVMRRGPATAYDRWEDTSGVAVHTLATEIAALACAAALAEQVGDARVATRLREAARRRDAEVEPLLYRRGGRLAEAVGVAGYYVRARTPGDPFPELDLARLPSTEISPDALALVRFGVRGASDPRVLDTVKVIDAALAVDLPGGRAWRRYPQDHYGEHADGAPFAEGQGIGRAWPLLVGERAHYELARGDREAARRLCATIERCANATGLLPEQVWDAPDLPARGLYRGRPTHSATPLGWAHAEYIKLCRSLADGRVFDLPSVQVADAASAKGDVGGGAGA